MSKFKEICEPLYIEAKSLKYPNFPKKYIPPLEIKGTSTNVLERQIVTFIQLHGWQAERIKNTGQARVEKMEQASGYVKQKISYTKGTGTRGTADVSATIEGKSIKIEVKNSATKDKMSDAQKAYQAKIDLSGGIYYVARDIDSFIDWFQENFKIHKEWSKAIMNTYNA